MEKKKSVIVCDGDGEEGWMLNVVKIGGGVGRWLR